MNNRIIYNMSEYENYKGLNIGGPGNKEPLNYNFVEPPIIIYWVTTMSKSGNVNMTPASLGTFMGTGPSKSGKGSVYYFTISFRVKAHGRREKDKYNGMYISPRDAVLNLDEVPECVISYCKTSMVDQIRLSACPIPQGISELEVAGLTPFKCIGVRPPGIAECPVNLEAKVIFSKVFTDWKLYVFEIDVVHVDEKLVREDREKNGGVGLAAIDPIFELHIENDHVFEMSEEKPYGDETKIKRFYFGRLDQSRPLLQEPYDIGPTSRLIGTFDIWMNDEEKNGKITKAEKDEILALKENWLANPDQKTNGQVYRKLTDMIKEIVWDRR